MQNEIDALKDRLKLLLCEPLPQREALDVLFELIAKLRNMRIPEAWTFAREAMHIAQQLNMKHLEADASLALADCSWKMAQYALAIGYYERALNHYLSASDHVGIAKCYNGMGIVAAESGELERALECFEHAIRHIKSVPASKLAAAITGNIGHTYFKLKRMEDSLCCFENALDKHTSLGDHEGIANMLSGIAGIQVERGEYEEALDLLGRVKQLHSTERSNRGMAVAMMNTGITLLRMGRANTAKQELMQARELMVSIRFTTYEPEILLQLMHASLDCGDDAEFDKYMYLYEEYRHEDIIQQARERHDQFRQFQNAEAQSLGQILK